LRETRFIEQNQPKWQELEKLLAERRSDPDRLSQLFVETTDDLSYARTFYPNRSVRVYLNGVAQRVFLSLYRSRRDGFGARFAAFWRDDLPQLVYESRRELLLSFATFVLGMLIGMVSSDIHPEFLRVILGDEYVDNTLENIRNGDPMAVYKDPDAAGMFVKIALNNLRVSLLVFIAGILASMGSVTVILYNAIMIGAFQYFFYQQGYFWDMFFAVWLHGTLEMSCMVIAGAAGILLGKGLLFPGTLTRGQAFMLTGRRGVTLLMGIAPLVVLAAVIESFFTRFTEMGIAVRGGVILGTLALVLGYFRWYAFLRADRTRPAELDEADLPPTPEIRFAFDQIKTRGEIFADVFAFFRKHFSVLLRRAFWTAAIATALIALLYATGHVQLHHFAVPSWLRYTGPLLLAYYVFAEPLLNAAAVLSPAELWGAHSLLVWALLTATGLFTYELLCRESGHSFGLHRRQLLPALAVSALGGAVGTWALWVGALWGSAIFVLAAPPLFLSLFAGMREALSPRHALARGFRFALASWPRLLGILLSGGLMANVVLLLVTAPFAQVYLEWISWNIPLSVPQSILAKKLVLTFLYFFGTALALPIMLLSMGFAFFVVREIHEAPGLVSQIAQVGQKKRVYGLEQEGD
jgi:uncharacterized membrane protein SpoIIM required for sporulation